MVVVCGVGCPVAGVKMSVIGKRPLLPAVNEEPVSVAPDDGVPVGGAAVALKEFTSAVPESAEMPSETI
jgi:hypothetical protein